MTWEAGSREGWFGRRMPAASWTWRGWGVLGTLVVFVSVWEGTTSCVSVGS